MLQNVNKWNLTSNLLHQEDILVFALERVITFSFLIPCLPNLCSHSIWGSLLLREHKTYKSLGLPLLLDMTNFIFWSFLSSQLKHHCKFFSSVQRGSLEHHLKVWIHQEQLYEHRCHITIDPSTTQAVYDSRPATPCRLKFSSLILGLQSLDGFVALSFYFQIQVTSLVPVRPYSFIACLTCLAGWLIRSLIECVGYWGHVSEG